LSTASSPRGRAIWKGPVAQWGATSSPGGFAASVSATRCGAKDDPVSTQVSSRTAARSAAIADRFDALEGLITQFAALPEGERSVRWSADADRITGDIARHLHGARHRISVADPAMNARN
jgi:hypothetical protein